VSELKIYADENVNFAIVQGLRARGVTAWTAKEVGFQGKSDQQQLTYAAEEKAVLFTHDDDLLALANQWLQEGKEHCRISVNVFTWLSSPSALPRLTRHNFRCTGTNGG